MKNLSFLLICLCAAPLSSTAQTASSSAFHFDFNAGNPWPQSFVDVMPSTPIDVLTTMEIQSVGTPSSTKPSGALVLKTEVGEVGLPWIATYSSGWLPTKSTETSDKLKLSFDVSASSARSLAVRLESFDEKKRRTGGVQTTFTPKEANLFEHFTFDLATLPSEGAGKFNANAPFVQLHFVVENPAWPDKAAHEVRIDNLRLGAAG